MSGVPAPPRWAVWAAFAAPLCAVPSALWRTAMGLGLPVGYDADALHGQGYPGWGTIHVVALSGLVFFLAFLTVGLVRSWGEVTPRWLPIVGGKPLSPRVVVGVAASGAVAVTMLGVSQLVMWFTIDASGGDLTGAARTVMGWCYAPLLLWGPLLGAVTFSYHRRHRLYRALASRPTADRSPPRDQTFG